MAFLCRTYYRVETFIADLCLFKDVVALLGTCQKLAGGRGGGDFQLSDENKMTLPR